LPLHSQTNKTRYRIAIQPDYLILPHNRQQSFSELWAEQLTLAGHEVCLVNVFQPDFFEQLKSCDGFLWWFPPIAYPRDMARRLMLSLGHLAAMPTVPAWKDSWHFDDKVAQSYLLQAAGIPVPRTWVFWQAEDARNFFHCADFPLVIKLTSGVFSENVRLLRNRAEAEYWVKRLFGDGLTSLDRAASAPWQRAFKRVRLAIRTLLRENGPSLDGKDFHKGYLLVQDFVPGNDFDTRITVIGKRAFGARRFNRPNDFRASGSGEADFDPSLIELDAVRLAFRLAAVLQAQTICMDILRKDGEPVICEISYYFMGWTVFESPGHWELQGDPDTGELRWIAGQVHPAAAILDDFLWRLSNREQSPEILGQLGGQKA